MHRIETLHESMDRSLQLLLDLPREQRPRDGDALLRDLERDVRAERRLLADLNVRVPGLSGVDPLAMLQRGELDRLVAELHTERGRQDAHWRAALAELRQQLDAAFVAVDLALADRA